MRVAVTGATGFVGAHTAVALLDAGHELSLLVRDPARVGATLGALGVQEQDVTLVTGDMTDADAVGRMLDGADAVLHAAALVSLDKSRGPEVLAANPAGARTVIGAALDAGIDPIVHVSSTASLFRRGLTSLHSDLPPAELASAYGRSKAEAEQFVRDRQAEGAPITITYPASVLGPPAGPAAGEVSAAVTQHLGAGMLPLPRASWSMIDVRDLAAVHVAALEPGRGPRRYMCGGTHMTMVELGQRYRFLTGRRFPVVRAPASAFRALGRLNDVLGRFVSYDTIFTGEAMDIFTSWVATDDRRTHDELGVEWRDPNETLEAAIQGLLAAGRVTPKQAGQVAGRKTDTA
jgi:nucleoside-diphosphate-sugar epimerase